MGATTDLDLRLEHELRLFNGVWRGGYYEGDPLDPVGQSSYGAIGYMSVLHATYLACIKPYITPHASVVEIGPGRGAWTKAFVELGAKEIWCLDALSREYNQFDLYVGAHKDVHYFQVSDFSCSMLPENHFDYMFSFGCFCHISFAGIREYMKNLHAKLKPGAHGFIMVADYDKYNQAIQAESLRILRPVFWGKRNKVLYWVYKLLNPSKPPELVSKAEDNTPRPGRWYHAGIRETCSMLQELGYTVISPDVGTSLRDPIIHFVK